VRAEIITGVDARRAGPGVSLAVLCAGLLFICGGCAGTGDRRGAAKIDSLHLLSVPTAVNFDNIPGPDGFAMRLFAKGTTSAKGVPLPGGVLELVMHDGVYAEGISPAPEPLRVWRFTGAELKRHAGKSAVGTGYRFTLRWENAQPKQPQITIVARFTPDGGLMVKSEPSSVAVRVK
jgi:hypothetical protein